MVKLFRKILIAKTHSAIMLIVRGFEAFLAKKTSKICCNNIQDRNISSNHYFLATLNHSLSPSMTEMNTISKEKSFEESNEITNTVIFRENLEDIIQIKNVDNINFKEEFHEILALIHTINNTENIENKSEKFYKVSDKISILIKKYSDIFTGESKEIINGILINLHLAGDLGIATSNIKEGLSETSSYKALKQWADWMAIFVEIVNINQNILTLERSQDFQQLATNIISLTYFKPREKRKNKLKMSLKHSAIFLGSIAVCWDRENKDKVDLLSHSNVSKEKVESNNWPLRIGERPYKELLAESQKKIHLLNDLEPATDEEIKYEIDTLNYLKEELKWDID